MINFQYVLKMPSVAVQLLDGVLEGEEAAFDDDVFDGGTSSKPKFPGRPRNSLILKLRRGMTLVHPSLKPVATLGFDAEVRVLEQSQTAPVSEAGFDMVAAASSQVGLRLNSNQETIVLIGSVRQNVTATLCAPHQDSFLQMENSSDNILSSFSQPLLSDRASSTYLLDPEQLRAGDRARVHFTFRHYPEYIHVGSSLIFTNMTIKGEGIVTKLYPAPPVYYQPPSSPRRKSAPTTAFFRDMDGLSSDSTRLRSRSTADTMKPKSAKKSAGGLFGDVSSSDSDDLSERTQSGRGMSSADLEVMRQFRIDQENAMALRKSSDSHIVSAASQNSGSPASAFSKSRSGGAEGAAARMARHGAVSQKSKRAGLSANAPAGSNS